MKQAQVWTQAEGSRVRVDSLKRGERGIASDGETYTYERVDGALSGVHYVVYNGGERTTFAGCAEWVPTS